ncbi:hypothetical protein HR13_00445 [Porphyromonas gulae]|uniref:DUF3320 domain-containing protein n=1 Tax=Porphyromonas gulae TaxID=111105 RepID=UPI000379AD76|nr:DUF3320 domain-containing protein [Porphyromonas gulae]KGN81371.1 hypothetical protein HR13_00445 [Porphyromonas gulae]
MEPNKSFSAPYSGALILEYIDFINFAIQHNGIRTISRCAISNESGRDWVDTTVLIEGAYLKPADCHFDLIPTGTTIEAEGLELKVDAARLISLTEGFDTSFSCTVRVGQEEIYREEYEVHLMAYDQWAGIRIMPEILSAFVTPNHPLLSRVLVKAAKFMERWTKSNSLSGYQSQDPSIVRWQVAAVYEALRSEGIVYSNPPASFEKAGQRIRLADKVLNEKIGTCIDLTLLFAACIEHIGLYPLLVLFEGHIFLGVWQEERFYSQATSDDREFLLKGCANGIHDIVFVESTMLTASEPVSFELAVEMATQQLRTGLFQMFIDVVACRLGGIKPLPQRVATEGGFELVNEGIKHDNVTKRIMKISPLDIKLDSDKELTKQDIWERKLLDISLRNNLVNIRSGRRALPLISYNIELLEDSLHAGNKFIILPAPSDECARPNEYGIYDSATNPEVVAATVTMGLHSNTLYSYLDESELQNTLKDLYRKSRTALEENGANSLFLAIGILRWMETEQSHRPRYAPILLMPIEIVRKGASRGYELRTRDEETMLNITMVELLKQQYGIDLSGLNTLPQDEKGTDIPLVLAAIRSQLRDKKGWDVLEESMVGLFSFNKFVMWNDIHTHADKLQEHPILNGLMNNRLQMFDHSEEEIDARIIDSTVPPTAYSIPIDVDSSQLEAVIESGKGKSFILHGPPGTGKSQTITNMIANALYRGKRVLFVAEKMAALSVVQKRLEKIGLAPFCLELHSNKVTKSHFLSQMQTALDIRRLQPATDYQSCADELFSHRSKLIAYVDALHQERGFGLSLFDCISGFLRHSGADMDVSRVPATLLQKEAIEKVVEDITQLDTVFLVSGHPAGHPLDGLEPTDPTMLNLPSLRDSLAEAKRLFGELSSAPQALEDLLGVGPDESVDGVIRMRDILGCLFHISCFNDDLFRLAENRQACIRTHDLLGTARDRLRLHEELTRDYAPTVLEEDGHRLRAEWQMIESKWFLPRFFASGSFVKRLRRHKPTLSKAEVPLLIERLCALQELSESVSGSESELIRLFDVRGLGSDREWLQAQENLHRSEEFVRLLAGHAEQTGQSYEVIRQAVTAKIGGHWQPIFDSNRNKLQQIYDRTVRLLQVSDSLAHSVAISLPSGYEQICAKLSVWIEHLPRLKDWSQWILCKRALLDAGAAPAIDRICHGEGSVPAVSVAEAFAHNLYRRMAEETIASDPTLQLFNGILFESVIEKYRFLTANFQELSKQELYCRLAAKIPQLTMTASNSSEVGILKRNIANGGRGTSIRKIIDQIPTLLPKLCPCMLMSPLSVAQFIDLDAEKFDLVIFDEASQMPTSESVGAIARGKALVVVGDPKQMPPTSFFMTGRNNEEDAYIDDMESILDDCISLSMPSRYLTWHYRSKHESLIAFSNSRYYDGKLFTFPSTDDRVSKVSLVKIDGVYDKSNTRSNRKEAQAIVDEIIRRLEDPALCERSIGVVSFSQAQQNLVEDMLMDALSTKPELEQKALHGAEPIFIKNLENVQGDERDVILFSIGYGPDKDGKVSMNFGPLNNKGGERRLNVAVSRARYEMIIYTSLSPEQIDLKRTNSLGVEGLRLLLEFAAHGLSHLPNRSSQVRAESAIVTDLAAALRSRGYKTDTMIGCSNFKIDLGIRHPQNPEQYLLGILCDGKNYFETKTTRDREVVRPGVLRMLGWNIHRVWSVDWFENKDRVIDRIVEQVDALLRLPAISSMAPVQPVKKFSITSAAPLQKPSKSKEQPYRSFPIEKAPNHTADLSTLTANKAEARKAIRSIVQTEQPITDTLLYRRVVEHFGLSRVSPRLRTLVDSLTDKLYHDPVSFEGSHTLWIDSEAAEGFDYYRTDSGREISEIPTIEIMNALMHIMEEQLALPRLELCKLAAQLLGFARNGTKVQTHTDYAVEELLRNGKFRESDRGMIALNE